ncbi:hypothetical protein C8R45DRAFT_923842 [Mycena sanguinolenta]|nr:hypothetical protein C8R45DRAFT_923842 [Mycena sanguinolenta]
MTSSQRSLFFRQFPAHSAPFWSPIRPHSPSTNHWIDTHPLPANPALFDGVEAEAQRKTTELLLYSTTLDTAGQVCWPLVGGEQVPAVHLAKYLQHEKVFWPCFCAMISSSGPKLSSRIVIWSRDLAVAVCHYERPRCQFFYSEIPLMSSSAVNLSSIFKTCTTKQEYIPVGPPPDSLRARSMFSGVPGSLEAAKGPLTGYLGDSGESQIEVVKSLGDPELFFPQYLTLMVSDVDGLDNNEMKALTHLASGRGLDQSSVQHLIGHCSKCQRYFLTHFMPDHVAGCRYTS